MAFSCDCNNKHSLGIPRKKIRVIATRTCLHFSYLHGKDINMFFYDFTQSLTDVQCEEILLLIFLLLLRYQWLRKPKPSLKITDCISDTNSKTVTLSDGSGFFHGSCFFYHCFKNFFSYDLQIFSSFLMIYFSLFFLHFLPVHPVVQGGSAVSRQAPGCLSYDRPYRCR